MTVPDPQPPRTRGAITTLIIGVLVMQVLTGFKVLCPPRKFEALQRFRVACAPTLWPFVDYNMYNGAHYPGWIGQKRSLIATLDDGTERVIEPEEVGLNAHDYRRWVIHKVMDGKEAAARDHLSRWSGPTARVTALRVDVEAWQLEDDGSLSELPVEHGTPLLLDGSRAR